MAKPTKANAVKTSFGGAPMVAIKPDSGTNDERAQNGMIASTNLEAPAEARRKTAS